MKKIFAAGLAAVMALVGGPAATVGAVTKARRPAYMRSVSTKKQQEWRRDHVAKKFFRWRGVGLLSRGPRWPTKPPKRAVRCKVVAQDATTYVQLNTGELVRYPPRERHTRQVRRMIQRFKQEARHRDERA